MTGPTFESADAWKSYGDTCMAEEDFAGAMDAYFQALQLDANHPSTRYNMALVHLELNEYDAAIALVKAVLATRPDDIEALSTLGWAQLWKGDNASAVLTFRRGLMRNPHFAPAHVGLGWVYMAQSPPALGRAADAFARAIALETDDPEAYFGLATVCEMREEPEQAVPLLEDAHRMWPDDLRSSESLARVYEGLGNWQSAAHHLMHIALERPADADLARRIATLFDTNGAPDRAAVFWKRALRVEPEHADSALALALVLLKTERADEAIDAYLGAIARNAEDPQAYAGLGHAYFMARRWAEALEAYAHAARRLPDDATIPYNMGNAYLEADEPINALWSFQRALKLDPLFHDARVGMGWAYFAQNKFETARETFEEALAHQPDDAHALDGLGSTLWRLGIPSLAIDALEYACQADPAQGGLRFKLGMIFEATGRMDDARRVFAELAGGTYGDERAADALARIQSALGPT